MTVQRPSGVNVGVNNPGDIVYVKGNENKGGSVRFGVSKNGKNCKIENEREGIFQLAGLELGTETVLLGLDMSIKAQGGSLRIDSKESGLSDISVGAEFNDFGAGPAKVPILETRVNRLVINSNTTGELVTKNIEGAFQGFRNAFRYKFYRKTGSVAATKPVTIEISKGSVSGGEVIFREVMPASQWSANTEVEIDLRGGLNITPGVPFLSTLFSDADFSVIGDDANGGHFFALDIQSYFFEALISASHGTDRFLFTNNSGPLIDNNGNILLSGKEVIPGDLHSHDIGASTMEL